MGLGPRSQKARSSNLQLSSFELGVGVSRWIKARAEVREDLRLLVMGAWLVAADVMCSCCIGGYAGR